MKLWENANKALEELLVTKASTDAHRQRAIWKLGVELHWNKSHTANSIKEVKAICCQAILDAKTTCSMAVKEAKTTQNCLIQEAEATCSTGIREVKVWKGSQAELL